MLLNKIKTIFNAIRPKTRRDFEHEYLAQAKDLTDLERRIKHLENPNLRHWV